LILHWRSHYKRKV